jgi:hypothetical protein
MPAMLRIDTLKFARSLAEAGMDRRQAEALVQGLSDADTSDFATKTDISELRAEIADLRTELRTGLAAVRTEMGDLKAELFRFMYLQAMGIVGLTVGLTVTLVKLLP